MSIEFDADGQSRDAHRRILGVPVAAFLLLAMTLLSAAVRADELADAEALVRAGKYQEAYKLLEPLEESKAGDLKFDYLLARSALESGNPSKASFIYERILAIEPNFVGVRVEMGRAYLALGDYARAKLEFETVIRIPNLPPDIRQQAEAYGKLADQYSKGKKTVAYGYMEYGYGYDSNPFSAVARNPITIAGGFPIDLPLSSLARTSNYNAVSLGGEVIHALPGGFSLFAGGDARARFYNQLDPADNMTVDLRGGVGYSAGKHSVRVGVLGGKYYLDHNGFRRSLGGNADYRILLNDTTQLTTNLTMIRFKYDSELLQANDYDLYSGLLGINKSVFGGRAIIGLSVSGGYETADPRRQDGDKRFGGLRLTVQGAFSERIGSFLTLGATMNDYLLENALFGLQRRDYFYDATAGMTFGIKSGWSVRPQVSYYKNVSNIDLYRYDRTDVSFNIRKDF
jgi:tetratricopeptide (TPR) repeat protein